MSLVTVAPSLEQKFDPDAFLRETTAQPFDPDAFLHDLKVQEMAKGIGPVESGLRGAAQNALLGWTDEAAGAMGAIGKQIRNAPVPKGTGYLDVLGNSLTKVMPEDYRQSRDEARLTDEAAYRANPKAYVGGGVVGGAPYWLLKNVPALNSLLGAVQGAGYSRGDTPAALASDTAVGAGIGYVGGKAAEGIGAGANAVVQAARGGSAKAAGRASEQANSEVTQAIQELSSKYGGEVQKGNRQIENMRRLEASFSPEQRAVFDQLKSTGVIDRLEHQLADSTLANIPGQAETILTRKGALEAAQQAAPQSIADRTAELSKSSIGPDLMSLAKSYGEPLAAAALAPVGMKTAAGMIFGRTRMGKALALRAGRPGNQIAIYDLLANVAGAPNTPAGELFRNALMRTPVPLLLSE